LDQTQIEFLRQLMQDVQLASDALEASDTLADRRNLLRTMVSAAEGATWVYRTHIFSTAKEMDATNPLMEMAFAEASFSVSEKGEIIPQARFVSLTAAIRMATRVAQSLHPDVDVDFGCSGWNHLRGAIVARNRITHPKNMDDLSLSKQDIQNAKEGFFWLLSMSMDVMELCTKAFAAHVAITKDFV
jgi:hypothetical protein